MKNLRRRKNKKKQTKSKHKEEEKMDKLEKNKIKENIGKIYSQR